MSDINHKNNNLSIERLKNKIEKAFHSFTRKRITSIFLISIVTFGTLFILLTLIEARLYLPAYFKIGCLLLIIVFSLIVPFRLHKRLPSYNFKSFYYHLSGFLHIESLRNALDLTLQKKEEDSPFHFLAIKQNLDKLNQTDIDSDINSFFKNHTLSRFFNYSLGSLLVVLILFLSDGFWNSPAFNRTVHFWQYYSKPIPYHYHLAPGDTVISQGTPFISNITFRGKELPTDVKLAVKTHMEQKYRQQKMQLINDSSFASDALTPVSNIEYYVMMDGFRTPVHHVMVQLKPRFESLKVDIKPPAYTLLDNNKFQYPFNSMSAYPGSKIGLSGIINKPLKSLVIRHTAYNDSNSPELFRSNNRDSINTYFSLNKTDTISFSLTDQYELHNDNPFSFVINALKDQPPTAIIDNPAPEISKLDPDSIRIDYELSDDFGFHDVYLHYELSKAYVKKKVGGDIRLKTPEEAKATGSYVWKLKRLNLKPLDVLNYWIEVRDNDDVAGYQKSRSEQHVIRMASLAESIMNNDQQQDSLSQSFSDLKEQNNELRQEFQQFQDQLRANPYDTYKNTQKLEDIRQRQAELDKKVDAIQKKYVRFQDKLKNEHALSDETLRKYQQLKKLIDEIKDPALKKALEELQKSLNNVGQNQIQKALENYKFNESVYQQRLQRTIDLFQNLKLNAHLEQLAKLFDNMKQREQHVRTSKAPASEKSLEQQDISKDLQQAGDRLGKLPRESPQRLQKMVEQLNKELNPQVQKTQKELQKNIKNLNQSRVNQKSSENQQRSIEHQLAQISQKIRDTKIQMNQQQVSINLMALKSILQDLILLSESQEKIATNVDNLPDKSTEFRQEARSQRNILQSFKQVSDSLTQVSSVVPALSDEINVRKLDVQNKMNKSVSYLANRSKGESAAETRYALGGINQLSSMIASLIDQMSNQQHNGGSGSGMSLSQMLKQLRKLSGQQKQLNDQIQQLINDLQGNRLSEDQLKRFKQMARTQNGIRRQIKELQESGGLDPGDKTLSELQRLQEQMEKSINDLRGGSKDQPFVQRQQNILARMLSSEKALEERGLSKKRHSESAKDTAKAPPPEMTIEALKKILRNQINGENQTKYNEYYQQLIQKYFELLQKNESPASGNN